MGCKGMGLQEGKDLIRRQGRWIWPGCLREGYWHASCSFIGSQLVMAAGGGFPLRQPGQACFVTKPIKIRNKGKIQCQNATALKN